MTGESEFTNNYQRKGGPSKAKILKIRTTSLPKRRKSKDNSLYVLWQNQQMFKRKVDGKDKGEDQKIIIFCFPAPLLSNG